MARTYPSPFFVQVPPPPGRPIFEMLQANSSKKSPQCNDLSDFGKSVDKLQIFARFLIGFCLEILKILSRPTNLACVNPALDDGQSTV